MAAIEEHLVELRVVPGPRDDWLVDPDALVQSRCRPTDYR
ncbi:allophanate hydrolase [Mycobacterium tuberculosis]|uniref:Allophanate hydrolase n=1 Tax=Mycobacterium tuberculosis TaxID=1773 RepID=A0A916LCA4_MYCTX|nr:allophanate hydrolase [Mycobacterium tuberculosis]